MDALAAGGWLLALAASWALQLFGGALAVSWVVLAILKQSEVHHGHARNHLRSEGSLGRLLCACWGFLWGLGRHPGNCFETVLGTLCGPVRFFDRGHYV